ncbi:S8 family serine peptidase [Egicoccus halophilus]|uniref:SLH domain-containing protein n=1 Tax=Egicoccus halophilus TaxID=1670830 RepID=A0A8J3ADF1_9ACTN|nr:S8 family serine peptidase [Egicoccus halophilus]GGI05943.1 hypothetical protein GCM10011354_16630 [Egicoccus halophilus]
MHGPPRPAAAVAQPVPVASAGASGDAVVVDGSLRLLLGWAPDAAAAARAQVLDTYGLAVSRAVSGSVDAVDVPPDEADALARRLRTQPEVELVEVDRWLWAAEHTVDEPVVDDPLFRDQWGLHNSGRPVEGRPTAAGTDVRAGAAWQRTRGAPEVLVALIDGGVDLAHPDLAGAIWTIPREAADGRDLDGNGYVDDLHGWNFVDDTPDVTNVSRQDWHGTAVAGIIAARADDGVGIAGMAPEVTLLPLRTFVVDGSGPGRATLAATLEAFAYARRAGADLVNASWVHPSDSRLLRAAVRDAGVPVVAAAGNDGHDLTVGPGTAFPAGYRLPNLVSVTAVGPSGGLPSYANVGRASIDVGAPGVRIRTTAPGAWQFADGTSFATPFVTGALALARTAYPDAAAADLVDAVSWTSRVTVGTRDTTISRGMLDAAALLDGLDRPVCGHGVLGAPPFPDVPAGATHATAISCLRTNGVTVGDRQGRYGPGATLTRGQLATLLLGTLAAAGVELPAATAQPFTDVEHSVHRDAIERLAAVGIAQGDRSDRFLPDRPVTRAQLAALAGRVHVFATGEARAPSRNWFADDDASTHAAAVDVARDLGVVRGVAVLRFAPGGDTRRDQAASVLARLLDALARAGA